METSRMKNAISAATTLGLVMLTQVTVLHVDVRRR
jgi:hypothetical protein